MSVGLKRSEFAVSAWTASFGEEDWFDAMPGERLRIRVHSSAVEGRYTILEGEAQPLAGVPRHTHCEDETFLILDGVLTFEVLGERMEAGVGSIVVVPGGVPHAWRNFGDVPARSVATFSPGGIEDLILQVAGLSPEAVVDLAARYGTIVVGPPLERA
jgi:mannose-6-phosphate isomerase-like protein (cupin superfamily)